MLPAVRVVLMLPSKVNVTDCSVPRFDWNCWMASGLDQLACVGGIDPVTV